MRTMNASAKTFDLYWTTGKVMETGKNMETRVHGGGGGGFSYQGTGGSAPVSIRSTTVVHDQIFLTDKNNREHAFQLQDINVACREGNDLSVIWAIVKGKKTGPYITVYNFTTSQAYFNDAELNKLFRYPLWYLLAGIAACFILGNVSGVFYLGILVLPIVWILLGKRAAEDFKKNTDFKTFN